jgi:hypothetical protein
MSYEEEDIYVYNTMYYVSNTHVHIPSYEEEDTCHMRRRIYMYTTLCIMYQTHTCIYRHMKRRIHVI